MDKKLTDSEIIKELQGIRESVKRHIDLTNELGQDLLHIDSEYTGGSKVWIDTDYFKKVVKHFAHSNYLVKCMELIFEYINRLQAKVEKCEKVEHFADKTIATLQAENSNLQEKNSNLTFDLTSLQNDLTSLKAENERLKNNPTLPKSGFINLVCDALVYTETLEQYNKFKRTFKAEAYKECIEKVKWLWGNYNGYEFNMKLDNLLKELVGEDK